MRFQSSGTGKVIVKHSKAAKEIPNGSFVKRRSMGKKEKSGFESFKDMPMVNKQQNTLNFNNLNILVEGSRSRKNSKNASFRNFGGASQKSAKGTPSFFRSFECTHRFASNGIAPPFHSLDITMNNSMPKKEFKIEHEPQKFKRLSQDSPGKAMHRLTRPRGKTSTSTKDNKNKRKVSTAKMSEEGKTNYILFRKKNQMIEFDQILNQVKGESNQPKIKC